MRQFCLAFAMVASIGLAQDGPYKVQKTAKVGGDGGFDYVTADADGRRLYVGRSGNPGRVTVFNLDTLEKLARFLTPSECMVQRLRRSRVTGSPAATRS